MSQEYDKHPSFAMVQFNRISGNTGPLFGSALRDHGTIIRLSISKGQRVHEYGEDKYYASMRDKMIEVDLSAAQFAQLLTTMNHGMGVPGTLRYKDGEMVEQPTYEDTRTEADHIMENFDEKIEEYGAKIENYLEDIEKIIEDSKGMAKREKIEIAHKLSIVRGQHKNNMKFYIKQFQRSSERVVTSAKAEVEAFVTTVINNSGIKALKDMGNSLLIGDGGDE